MTKTLEYQKENGLLWEEVYKEMGEGPEHIAAYIAENTKDYQTFSQEQLHQ